MAAHPLDPPAAPAIASEPPPWESVPMAAHPLDPPAAPVIPSQPPPWEACFEGEDSSEDEESEDEVTNFSMGGPPPDMPPPIPGIQCSSWRIRFYSRYIWKFANIRIRKCRIRKYPDPEMWKNSNFQISKKHTDISRPPIPGVSWIQFCSRYL